MKSPAARSNTGPNCDLLPVALPIITDLKMPGVDGFELLEWPHRHHEFAPVPKLVLTSSSIDNDHKRAR